MGHHEYVPAPNGKNNGHLPPEALLAIRKARESRDSGILDDASDDFSEAITHTPHGHKSLGLLYLERADVHIALGRYEHGLTDLLQAREQIETLDNGQRDHLLLTCEVLIDKIPRDRQQLVFDLASTPEGAPETLPEPEVEVPEAVLDRPVREIGHAALVPRIQSAGA